MGDQVMKFNELYESILNERFVNKSKEIKNKWVDLSDTDIKKDSNLADELFEERETDQDDRHKKLERKAQKLVTRLEEAMKIGNDPKSDKSGGPCAVGDG